MFLLAGAGGRGGKIGEIYGQQRQHARGNKGQQAFQKCQKIFAHIIILSVGFFFLSSISYNRGLTKGTGARRNHSSEKRGCEPRTVLIQ
jgi:hypothetical protein